MHLFQKTTLPNGLRVVTRRCEGLHSATIGVWINAGSVYEKENERGLAHLLEHLVFKGTKKRSMAQIAKDMDSIGGHMNAFTERELVCYHVKVLSDHLPLAMELLCDFVTRPTLDPAALEIERGVVLEEIKGIEDEPEEFVSDLFSETIWPRSRWGRSILGTCDSVSTLQVSDLRRFLNAHYTHGNVLVAATGDVQHEQVVALAEKLLADLPKGNRAARVPAAPKVKANRIQLERDTEQVHVCIGTQAYAIHDSRRYAAWLLDSILTGGYSSRLFQEIREKRGLCYSIGSVSASYRKAGFWAVETSVAPEVAGKVVELISKELRRVREKGVTNVELKRAKEMSRINILLAEESAGALMNRIARNELYFGRQRMLHEMLDTIRNATTDEIQQVACEMFDPHLMNLAAIGPFEGKSESLRIEL